MRVSPTTRRGTWALAAIAWLGGCGLVWWLLPGVPRIVIPIDGAYCVGFTADSRWLVGRGDDSSAPSDGDVPFLLWDPLTGRQVSSWRRPDGAMVLPHFWSDLFPPYAVILFSEDSADGRRTYLYDLVAGRREQLPKTAPPYTSGDPGNCRAYLAVGGRYLVYETGSPNSPTVCWWDRTAERMVAEFPGLKLLDVKPDGRWLTTEYPDKAGGPWSFVVRELLSGKECGRNILPQGYKCDPWPAGDYLWFMSSNEWKIFELPSGRLCVPPQPGCPVAILPERRQLVSVQSDGADQWLVRSDLTNGQEIGRRRLPTGSSPVVNPHTLGAYVTLWKPESARIASTRRFLADLPIIGKTIEPYVVTQTIYDAANDSEVATITSGGGITIEVETASDRIITDGGSLSPDGRIFVSTAGDGSRLEIWDIPPRKPLNWLAIAAGVWALPVVWCARRRVRRLRAVRMVGNKIATV